jgi:hypothetical protein
MTSISGKIVDPGGGRLAGLRPELTVFLTRESSYEEWMITTRRVKPLLREPDDSFDFTITSSDVMSPPQPYTFLIRWLDAEDELSREDRWEGVWVPEGSFSIADLLGQRGLSPTQAFWQPTQPNPWPLFAYWVNTITGDVYQRTGTLMALERTFIGSIKGAKGDRGFKGETGEQGPSGAGGLTTDAAVAANLRVTSETKAAAAELIAANFEGLADPFADQSNIIRLDKLLDGRTMYDWGNSWLAGSPASSYAQIAADALGCSGHVSFATSGYRMQDTSQSMIGPVDGQPWVSRTGGVVLIGDLLNNLIEADTSANRAAASEGLRASVATLCAGARVEQSGFTFSNFLDTANAKTYASGGSIAIASSSTATATIPVAFPGTNYLLLAGLSGTNGERGGIFTIKQGGVTLATKDTDARTVYGKNARDYNNVAVRLPDLAAGTLDVTYSTSGRPSPTYGVIDALLPQMQTPPLIIVVKPIQTTINTHDKPALLAYLRTVPDTIAAEFGSHVLVVDPAPGWDPSTMLQSDGLHPNALGHAHIAAAVVEAIQRRIQRYIMLQSLGTMP